jgi:hypothetical protein
MTLGPYDVDSIMNYCDPKFWTKPQLSAGDIAGVDKWYGSSDASDAG